METLCFLNILPNFDHVAIINNTSIQKVNNEA